MSWELGILVCGFVCAFIGSIVGYGICEIITHKKIYRDMSGKTDLNERMKAEYARMNEEYDRGFKVGMAEANQQTEFYNYEA